MNRNHHPPTDNRIDIDGAGTGDDSPLRTKLANRDSILSCRDVPGGQQRAGAEAAGVWRRRFHTAVPFHDHFQDRQKNTIPLREIWGSAGRSRDDQVFEEQMNSA